MMSKKYAQPVYFDLDGVCQLKVYGEPLLVRAVQRELSFYQADPEAIPITLDLDLELGELSDFKKSRNPEGMSPYDFPGRHKLARWMIRFERLSQPPARIKFYGNGFSRMIVAKQVVEPAIRWLAQPLGFIFAHSTCLAQEGRGIVVAGSGGSGKTRMLLQWLKQGHPFLSDDFTILSYGQARRYVTPLRIGGRLLMESGLGKNLSASRTAGIYFRTALRKMLLGYARLQAKLSVQELMPGIKILDRVDLKAVAILEGTGNGLQPISAEEAADKLVKISQKEMYGFGDCLAGLGKKTGDPQYSRFFIEQESRLREYLKQIPCYKIPCVADFSLKELNALLEQLFRQ